VQRFILVIAAGWLVCVPVSVLAQGTLYKWTDSRGVAHYTNTPTDKNAKTVDDALPPASNFQRPTPPPEPTKETAKSAAGEPAPAATENPPPQATGEPVPETATDEQQPESSTLPPNQ
jgi:hypothetical protein